jgi:hypothetical protein
VNVTVLFEQIELFVALDAKVTDALLFAVTVIVAEPVKSETAAEQFASFNEVKV